MTGFWKATTLKVEGWGVSTEKSVGAEEGSWKSRELCGLAFRSFFVSR